MSAIVRRVFASAVAQPVDRLMGHLRKPLYRNGYALILNQVTSAGLGMVYWLLVARLFVPETVGRNVALLSTVLVLAAVAELSLTSAATRFVPRAGTRTPRLVLYMYGIALMAAGLVGMVFLSLSGWLFPVRDLLGSDPVGAGWLVAATMAWCIFRIQDGVLTGMRQAGWVLLENSAFNLSKILLVAGLWVLGRGSWEYGLIVSWFLPVPVVVLLVNGLIFWRLMPKHLAEAKSKARPITTGQVARSVAGDYAGSLLAEIAVRLLPLLVIGLVGSSASAYFNQAWVVASALYFVANGMASSFTVESAANIGQINLLSRRVLQHMAQLVVPATVGMLLFAPLLLSVFGADYAREGTTLLRWLTLAALPGLLNSWYLNYARVRIDNRSIILNQGLLCVITLGLSYWWLPSHGIAAIGVAWLAGQSVVATVVAVKTLPMLLSATGHTEPEEGMTLSRLWRRADWRFLSSVPCPRKSVCYSDGLLAQSVAAVSEQVVDGNAAVGGSCDLAVVSNPGLSTLRAAFAGLREGGVCYTEWSPWQTGGTWGIERMLRSAGFAHVQVYWPYPSPELARLWIPFQPGRAPYRYLANHLLNGNGIVQRVVAAFLSHLLRVALQIGVAPTLCALAYRGEQQPADPLAPARLEWAQSHGEPSSDSLSFLMQTGGSHLSNKVVFLLFAESCPEPRWVIKAPRLAEDAATLDRERDVLGRLHRAATGSEDYLVLPRIVLDRQFRGVRLSGQTALVGPQLDEWLRRNDFGEVAAELTDWQIALAKRSGSPATCLDGRSVTGRWLADLEALLGGSLDRKMVSQARGTLSELGELPAVCAHNDFAPWNIVRTDAGLAVFDWTDAEWEGLPMLDLVYALANLAFAEEDAWDTPARLSAYRRLLDPTTATGAVFQDALARYAREVGLHPDQIGRLRLATWIRHSYFEHLGSRIDERGRPLEPGLAEEVCGPLWMAELQVQAGHEPAGLPRGHGR